MSALCFSFNINENYYPVRLFGPVRLFPQQKLPPCASIWDCSSIQHSRVPNSVSMFWVLPSLPSKEYLINEYGSNKRIWNKISQNIKRILGKTYEYLGKKTVISKRIYSFIRDLRVVHYGSIVILRVFLKFLTLF